MPPDSPSTLDMVAGGWGELKGSCSVGTHREFGRWVNKKNPSCTGKVEKHRKLVGLARCVVAICRRRLLYARPASRINEQQDVVPLFTFEKMVVLDFQYGHHGHHGHHGHCGIQNRISRFLDGAPRSDPSVKMGHPGANFRFAFPSSPIALETF